MKKLAIIVIVILSFVVFYRWGLRPMMQNVVLLSSELTGESVISEMAYVDINGVPLWVTIRGTNKDNPVLVVVHGGPGMPQSPFQRRFDARLVEHFTVVHFDQRGAGKSIRAITDDSQWSLSQFEYALTKLEKEKVTLVGHSWGSFVAIGVAHERPDLLTAYVGVGQMVNIMEGELMSYNFVLKEAASRGMTEAVVTLKEMGVPPYRGPADWAFQRGLLVDFGGVFYGKEAKIIERDKKVALFLSPDYSRKDIKNYHEGYKNSIQHLMGQIIPADITQELMSFDIPIYFLLGRHDFTVPYPLAARYLKQLSAPDKRVVWFEESSHYPYMEEPAKYCETLVNLLN
jgi:pimeloyl-ACP methyl ester carboxylesterase